MIDKSSIEKIISNSPIALVLIGVFLILTGAAGGWPKLSLNVQELGWRIAIAIIGLIVTGIGGLLIWREKSAQAAGQPEDLSDLTKINLPKGQILQRIPFDYMDTLDNRGWQHHGNKPSCKSIVDGFVGKAIEISADDKYAMDFYVNQIAHMASSIEFDAKYEKNAILYTFVSVHSQEGSEKRNVWVAIQTGSWEPRPYGSGKNEWTIYVDPEPIGGGWFRFKVDLNNAVKATFGKDGWQYQKLRAFRIRGNISISQISVFK